MKKYLFICSCDNVYLSLWRAMLHQNFHKSKITIYLII